MANRKCNAGYEAVAKKGWWKSYRWLILRRICQFSILGMFLSGSWFGLWILHGNYTGSLLLDRIPLTDPLITLQSLASGYLPDIIALTGALIVTLFYAIAGKRLFCSWVCPINPITDLASWLRRKFNFNQSASIPRNIRYVLLVVILLGCLLTGSLIWEWINPVSLMGRSLIMGFSSSALIIFTLFLFDLLVVEHGWCGHICPMGAMHGVIGSKGIIIVSATNREQCDRCMDCFHVCPEPQVLRNPVLNEQSSVQIISKDCMNCGRCIDVCAENVFTITTRWKSGVK